MLTYRVGGLRLQGITGFGLKHCGSCKDMTLMIEIQMEKKKAMKQKVDVHRGTLGVMG